MSNTYRMSPLKLITILPLLVSALPNAPAPTPAQLLDRRANGGNIIGFALSGTETTYRTRTCNAGFFSTSGKFGGCCTNTDCLFQTACKGSTVFYANGHSATCDSGVLCGTGLVFKTPGDQSPLTFLNCQAEDWTVTRTFVTTTTGVTTVYEDLTTIVPVISTRQTTSTTATPSTTSQPSEASSVVPRPNTSTTSQPLEASSVVPGPNTSTTSSDATPGAGSTTRAVTMSITNSDGTLQSTTSLQAIPLASGTPNPQNLSQESENNGGGGGGGSSNVGAIAGGAAGGVAVLVIVAGVIGFLMWKRNKKAKEAAAGTTTPLNPDASGPSSSLPMQQAGYRQQGGYPRQDYKDAPGGYADAPVGPQHLDRPSELYGGNFRHPVEMPAQHGYGR